MRVLWWLLVCGLPLMTAGYGRGQDESRLHSDVRRETEALALCKSLKLDDLAACGEALFTGQPIHVAVGSLAPQNGIAGGLALAEHKDFENRWRLNFNVDAVASGNGSWRVGAYAKAYRLTGGVVHVITPVAPGGAATVAPHATGPLFRNAPLFNLYSETTSLERVYFFGLGNVSSPAGRTAFGFTENITGVSGILPLPSRAAIAVLAEFNGRFPSLRGSNSGTIASVQQIYAEGSAPGLSSQPGFFQAGEGLRIHPSVIRDRLRLNYFLQFQQFVAPGETRYTFRRWNADFGHEIPLYRNVRLTAARDQNGPDDCSSGSSPSSSARPCPHISRTQNLEGSIGVRLFLSESFAKAGSSVPFYFAPTLGGSDINGAAMLASYPDYRFRGNDVLMLRGSFEHSLGKLPAGFLFRFDEGRVGVRRDEIAFDHLRHTLSAGFTVHAGGLPVVSLLFSWGGKEGEHTTATISNVLLGGSARPSLF